jgi:hypothetical protein
MKDPQNLMRLSAHFPWKVFSQVLPSCILKSGSCLLLMSLLLFFFLPPLSIWNIFLFLQFNGFMEGGWERNAESGEENVHVEVIKIDHPLVHVFAVRAFAAVFKEKLDLFIHCPKDFP